MIREPTVGMRVRFNGEAGHSGGEKPIGKTGRIERIDGDGFLKVRMDDYNDFEMAMYGALTEIKESDMKKGDLVKLTRDVNVVNIENDNFYNYNFYKTEICNPHKGFRIVFIIGDGADGVFIRAATSGKVYFTSMKYLRLMEPEVLEVSAEQMMRDLKEKYGCEVKIVKE